MILMINNQPTFANLWITFIRKPIILSILKFEMWSVAKLLLAMYLNRKHAVTYYANHFRICLLLIVQFHEY